MSRARAALVATLLLGALTSCAAGQRMVRGVPFWRGDDLPDAERVNVWPLFYRAQGLTVVLWPLFDHDDRGFALRPLVAREGGEWSVLYPLAGWNTESDDWWLLPAYSLRDNRGLLPFFNLGAWNHVGPVWWSKDDAGEVSGWGLVPLFGTDGELSHAGPVWWERDREDAPGAWGIFPLAAFGERWGYLAPAWWRKGEDESLEEVGILPLFHYENEEGRRRLITPLGGRGWGGEGKFVNVLGPVFHHSRAGKRSYTAVAWPVFAFEKDGDEVEARVFPLLRYADGADGSSVAALAGLIERARDGENRRLRFAPLFSHNVGMRPSFLDALTLYGYRESDDAGERPDVSLHIGTPLLFHYRREGDRTEWGSLLNVLDSEAEGDGSSFSFLYYLYRQQRRGEQVRRDLFPFITWDSGPERSGFSFLWRLFRYERRGERTNGHFLFVPWGERTAPTQNG